MWSWLRNRKLWKNQRSIYQNALACFKKHKKELGAEEKETETLLKEWNQFILEKKDLASAIQCQKSVAQKMPRSLESPPLSQKTTYAVLSIVLTVFLALLLRQTWLEHQRIPSGSMRSTFLEKEHVIVSKTSYGINHPLSRYKLFRPDESLKRGDIVTFTAEGIQGIQSSSYFRGLFSSHKRLVKRLMALGGDRVYFYGGKVWILNSEGHLSNHLDAFKDLETLEYIPFQTPSGLSLRGTYGQSRRPIFATSLFGSMLEAVTKDENNQDIFIEPTTNTPLKSPAYHNYGIANFGNCRLLTKRQYFYSAAPTMHLQDEPYLLEISHHGSILRQAAATADSNDPLYLQRSILPLTWEAISRLRSALSTSRFVLENNRVYRFDINAKDVDHGFDLIFSDLPQDTRNGTFELQKGTLYKVGIGGQREKLSSHPLLEIKYLPHLFNCGIDWNKDSRAMPTHFPQLIRRFAYFNEGDLYCMGALLYSKEDPTLKRFIESEEKRHQADPSYPPFLDEGMPTKEKIEKQGLEIPEDKLLVLGDNHMLSGDSRFFGLIPQTNVEGRPVAIIWPPSSFSLSLNQPPLTLQQWIPTVVYHLFFLLLFVGTWGYRRYFKKDL